MYKILKILFLFLVFCNSDSCGDDEASHDEMKEWFSKQKISRSKIDAYVSKLRKNGINNINKYNDFFNKLTKNFYKIYYECYYRCKNDSKMKALEKHFEDFLTAKLDWKKDYYYDLQSKIDTEIENRLQNPSNKIIYTYKVKGMMKKQKEFINNLSQKIIERYNEYIFQVSNREKEIREALFAEKNLSQEACETYYNLSKIAYESNNVMEDSVGVYIEKLKDAIEISKASV